MASCIEQLAMGFCVSKQIPSPIIEEQKDIAKILSDMDAEITALDQKREKYKTVKQSM